METGAAERTGNGSTGHAARLEKALGVVLGTGQIPLRLRAWDGSEAGPVDAPVLEFRSRKALRRILWSPGQLGLSRAYVAGEIDTPGDIFAAFTALSSAGKFAEPGPFRPLTAGELWLLLRTAVRLGAIGPNPAPPPEEARIAKKGRMHSRRRDSAAISHHYDVGNDFYALVLGPSMVYSCAVWAAGGAEAPGSGPDSGLDAAQEAKLDLVCRKLGLQPGMRVLDVGCGWGSFALHAAARYGVSVVGVTLSREQAALARKRAADAGLTDKVDIRVQDYRDVSDGPFDAISSIGMSEHVGRAQTPAYASALYGLLRPGGRLLNHAISWNAGPTSPDPDSFIPRYVFPDGEMISLGEMVAALETARFEVLDVEALRRHYALTLRAWVSRLEENWDEAVKLAGAGRARVWRLYMASSAIGFETGLTGVNQVLVRRPGGEEPPLRRTAWM
ncbi:MULTISPECIES: class I SAM-dependent methyltransferase [unclassified Arthrobacter]|jgi:cyclopropane-fatty-acyl-phospholipid synthase|uniref:class I SAM-dependent methyltransferase n=1 Tax=Micrococcaceae TaxID=1268 RepID=UPI00035F4B2D|nr:MULTISPECIES: class I SAM-dependent methyltransferase [unclassified Arthrobacter]KRE73413.1 cyclopropane-fatty-acyl-phospholipid synthase [Arthrobacter sp. Soil761]TWD56570.1 cyclopropane-fatty-acyl-phospholipid synthase [Arthrobacter sp. AG367]BCW54881.1 cyclopropane-fatty-acyl-phospholipid synthase [Arthrobacter sp. StoSoilB19]BCW75966.1 cyclopropane-fatty-acyl-phospholipid synthase [Arthrobacter sp. NicSoilB11]